MERCMLRGPLVSNRTSTCERHMTEIMSLPIGDWNPRCSTAELDCAIRALEHGCILLLPHLSFPLEPTERPLLSPTFAGQRKNISFDGGRLQGAEAPEAEMNVLRNMMSRFATHSAALLRHLLPRYADGLQQGRVSYRPVEIAGRSSSWRKDDTRLHVDSFPSSPVQGRRILRVFSNVNPHGQCRRWRLGESFEVVASRYLDSLPNPIWGSSHVLNLLGITKSRRTPYDHFMLQLHDRMKADPVYQSQAEQSLYDMPAGATWIVYTDQVSHAAMAGQYAFEQTYSVPVDRMLDPSLSPLRVLERLLGRELT